MSHVTVGERVSSVSESVSYGVNLVALNTSVYGNLLATVWMPITHFGNGLGDIAAYTSAVRFGIGAAGETQKHKATNVDWHNLSMEY